METALSKLTQSHQSLPLSLRRHRPSISRPISSLCFRFPSPLLPSSTSSLKSSSSSSSWPIKASSSSKTTNPKPQIIQTLNPYPFSLLRTTLIAAVTATALFFARFNFKPAIAGTISSPPTVEESISDGEKGKNLEESISDGEKEKNLEESISDGEREKNLEELLNAQPDDVPALKSLLELKIKNKKVQEAVQIIDQLIKLEPEDNEWPLLKSHMYCYSGDTESAKIGFNEILSRDPLRVEAYHGLVLAATQSDSDTELKEVEKRIRKGTEMVKKEKKEDLRDFMLLLAQVRVIEGEYNDALKIYEALVKEEPLDFRPYLCQGIIYTLLRQKDEAEKNFQRYRRLIPEGHPYASYLDDNLIAAKLFSQKVENDRARGKS